MQVRKIAFAAAALVAGSAAFAAGIPAAQIAYSSGSSASKGNVKVGLTSLCTTAGGVLTEFTDGSTNVSTYTCASTALTGSTYATATPMNFSGTVFAELRLNVTGGSFTAACLLANWPAGTACATANPGGAPDAYADPSTVGAKANNAATDTAPPAGSTKVGGIMDVEPAAWPAAVTAGIALPATVIDAGFAQVFSPAASIDLYNAMFKDQGLAATGCPVDGSGNPTTYTPACTPSIGRGQIATILQANAFNHAYVDGAHFLAAAIPAGTNLNYARRVDTSGTQASAQAYFLGTNCNSVNYAVIPAGTGNPTTDGTGAITVFAFPTTGGVKTELNSALGSGTYTFGLMSGENNPTGQNWKWLRLEGGNMFESSNPGSASQTNAASAINGLYDYWFDSKVAVAPVASATQFWSALTTSLASNNLRAQTLGLFNNGLVGGTQEGTMTKGGNVCSPVVSQ